MQLAMYDKHGSNAAHTRPMPVNCNYKTITNLQQIISADRQLVVMQRI